MSSKVTVPHQNSLGRELMFKFCYQLEAEKIFIFDLMRFEKFCVYFGKDLSPQAQEFGKKILIHLFENWTKINDLITAHSHNWKISRMAIIDRVIIRLAIAENLVNETPRKVILDESIELAKTFGTLEASRFVNGILHECLTKE